MTASFADLESHLVARITFFFSHLFERRPFLQLDLLPRGLAAFRGDASLHRRVLIDHREASPGC